jgi:carboxypeptidase A2
MRATVVLAFCALLALAAAVRYEGHQVLRVTLHGEQHLRHITDFIHGPATRVLGLDWWEEPRMHGDIADVRVPPQSLAQMKEILSAWNMTYSVMIEDVQALVDVQMAQPPSDDWFTNYHSYDDTIAWVTTLVAKYPTLATMETIGKSYEGRDIVAVHVTGKGTGAKPAIFYDGGIHAREWIAPATVEYILYTLLTGYGTDPAITPIVDGIAWTIVPIFNVDGYVYTWTTDRMWRKSRTPNTGSSCVGTDPCRNGATGFGGQGSSSDPCDDTYHGPAAFSEPCVKVVTDALSKIANLKGYVNFHSYSQLFMSPYGYTTSLPPKTDYNAQTTLGQKFVTAVKGKHGMVYEEGPVATTIYMAAGIINDWTYAQLKVLYSFACELRDTGTYGFLLPTNQIVPTGEEIFEGVKVMAGIILDEWEQSQLAATL